MTFLEINQVSAMLQLAVAVGDGAANAPVASRQARLLDGVAQLIRADAFLCGHGTVPALAAETSRRCIVLDGGWISDAERASALALFNQATRQLPPPEDGGVTAVRSREETSERQWALPSPVEAWRQLGFRHLLWFANQSRDGLVTHAAFLRRTGMPPFSRCHCSIVQLMLGRTPWFRQASSRSCGAAIPSLTPREEQVMMHLLRGDSCKQVASKLLLSEHTVGDYVKAIYRKAGVSSRAELLAKFIAGDGSANQLA